MTGETKTDLSQIATAKWMPSSRRHDERPRETKPEPRPDHNEEPVFPAVSSPPPISWPRVFPGI